MVQVKVELPPKVAAEYPCAVQLAVNAFALLRAKRLLLVEFVPGKNVETLARTTEDVVPACKLARKTLARLQLARTESIGPMPVEMVNRDLAMAPFSPGKQNSSNDA